jgi:uncharacterized 2Fe-2S/4Fe-4S cluster protein (DUF4445 family)
MRAAKGAIQKIRISPKELEVNFETICKVKPLGICGSGYIDLLAEMLRAGILDKDGKIREIKHPRVRRDSVGREFVVVFQKDSATESDIVISEADIDNLKRAKGAIYAAVSILVNHLGLDFTQVKNILIAGGFGTCLDIANAITIGLLPDVDISRFIFIGNASLAGARQAVLSYEAKQKAEEIARKMTYFELSVEPKYMEEYMAALFFPHTDLSLFPNVKLK